MSYCFGTGCLGSYCIGSGCCFIESCAIKGICCATPEQSEEAHAGSVAAPWWESLVEGVERGAGGAGGM
jgi:hypothetical protein